MIRSIAVLLSLAGLGLASEAEAQYVVGRGYAVSPSYARPAYGPSATSYSSGYAGSPGVVGQPSRAYQYSYYTRSPLPARTYVGYGASDFPFHGVAYGHPYDPWTWPMMSGYYANGLARYYDPPVK